MKTANDILNHKQMLFDQNQYLVDVQIKSVADIFSGKNMLPLLEEYIEESWAYTYGDLERFVYNQGFLRWAFGYQGLDSKSSLVMQKDRQTIALFLHTPRTLLYQGQEVRCGINTCMSVHPGNTTNGLSKYLMLAFEQACMDADYDGVFGWFHSSLPKPVTSYRVVSAFEGKLMDNWGDYNLKIRILNPERVTTFSHLKTHEVKIARLLSRYRTGSPGSEYEEINGSNCAEVLDFMNNFARNQGEGRLFEPDEFKQYAMFDNECTDFAVLGIVKRVQGQIQAAMIGYYIYMSGKDRESIFFIDQLCIDKQLDFNQFIKNIELIIIEHFNPSCIMCMDQRLGIAQRYLPSGSILACRGIAFKPSLIKKDRKKRMVPIIDMK